MIRRFLLFFLLLSTNLKSQNSLLSESVGKVLNYTANQSIIDFNLSNSFAQISCYNDNTIRVRVAKLPFNKDESFAIDNLVSNFLFKNIVEEKNQIQLITDSLKVVINKDPFRVSFYNHKNQLINSDEEGLGISWWGQQVSCYKKLHPNEKFIGLGEKTGGINRRGNFYYHWNSDVPGYSLNADPLYSTIPFFIGIHDSLAYGIFFDNTHKSYFNFGGGANEELYHFGADAGEMNYYFFASNSIPKIIENYTSLTGRTPMPPLWSLGFQQSRWGYNSQQQIIDIAKTFREKKMPADVMVSDIPYMDNYKIFTWNKDGFPNLKAMMNELKKLNFELVNIVDPGIKVEKGYRAYDEGLRENHFAKYPNGIEYIGHVWPGKCHFPDFTKTSTRNWWGKYFKESLIDMGIRGFWNDMNEPAAWGREFPNIIEFGETGNKKTLFEIKNAYGSLMSKATYEGTKRLMNGERPFVLTRAGYAGLQKYTAQWTGDNVSTDEHMLLGFRLLNSMGLSGVPFVGMDIGGFMGNPSPELFIRWMSLGVYSPLFRNHTHINYNYREPWLFGEENTNVLRSILEQRYQLLPYLYSTFYQAHKKGIPINRMLPIYFPNDEKVYYSNYENQFLFGDNLLVCPTESNKKQTEVYLPGDFNWYRLHTDEIFKGGKNYFVESPLTNVPVFVKEGAIIPKQSTIQNTKEKGDGILQIHIWNGKEKSNFVYYEDDGETYNYEKNVFYKRNIEFNSTEKSIYFSQKEGTYISKFHKVQIYFHAFEALNQVQSEKITIDVSKSNNIQIVEISLKDSLIKISWK